VLKTEQDKSANRSDEPGTQSAPDRLRHTAIFLLRLKIRFQAARRSGRKRNAHRPSRKLQTAVRSNQMEDKLSV